VREDALGPKEVRATIVEGPAGRTRELELIDGFLDGLSADGAGAFLIGGEPGIGKTTLWRAAIERARDRGMQVLVTRPAEEEMPMSGVGLVDLFERADTGAALPALNDPFTTGRAVLENLRSLVDRGPVIIAIDDLPWLDSVTARALRYSLRRVRAEPVAVVATVRRDAAASDPLSLSTTLPPERISIVEPGPLSLDDLRRAIGGVVTTISRPVLRSIHEASGGNPMLAIELARGVGGSGPVETWLQPSTSDPLRIVIAQRVDAVSTDVKALLETIAALGRTPIDRVRAAMSPGETDRLLAEAEREGLVVVDDDLTVRPSHPVIGSVAYAGLDRVARQELHSRLAELAIEPDDRARHLALATESPDAGVAALLDEAAGRADRRGAPDLAAGFTGHALRLTPPDAEADRRRREIAEITYLSVAGEASRALAAADRLVATLPPGRDRAAVLIKRFEVEDDDLELGDELLTGALEDAAGDDRLRSRVLDMLAWLRGMYRGDLASGIRCARAGHEIAERIDDPRLLMITESSLALMGALVAEPQPERLARAVTLERALGEAIPAEGPLAISGKIRSWAGDLRGARRCFEEALAQAARSGSELTRMYRHYDLSLLACAQGDLAAALELAMLGIEAAADAEFPPGSLRYPLALAQGWLGDSEAARETAGELFRWGEHRGERPAVVRAHMVTGLVALSEGDVETAAGRFGPAIAILDDMGVEEPGAFPVMPDAIEAFARSGDVDRAEACLDRLRRQVERSRGAWAAAGLERSRGVLHLAAGEPDAAAEPLGAAEAAFDGLGYGPDAVRAQLLRGNASLRSGRRAEAADVLAGARDRFAAMGATLWVERADEELERVAPGRTDGELTATEGRVAAAVAGGMKNKEVARAMYLSVATVEAHLTRIYRKLGIRSRGELIRLMTEGALDATLAERRTSHHSQADS
jgi:DNA-binding CsgD family transcriptional regulator